MTARKPRSGAATTRSASPSGHEAPALLDFVDSVQVPQVLSVTGAREHNLRNVNAQIPHRSLSVFTGVSGSGKSSLAFATIFAEAQRRSLQHMSTFARQFMPQLAKPDVDQITGLCSAVAVDQRSSASRSPRSTVGTVTEVYDLMRAIFAQIGHPCCVECGRELKGHGAEASCPKGHDTPVPELASRAFSFNLPFGQCPGCVGVGTQLRVDPETLISDPRRSLRDGAIAPWRQVFTEPERMKGRALANASGESEDTPWQDLSPELRDRLLNGEDIKLKSKRYDKPNDPVKDVVFTGVIPWLYMRYRKASGDNFGQLEYYMRPAPCPDCEGRRLAPAQLAVRVSGKGISEVSALPIDDVLAYLQDLEISERERSSVAQILSEMDERLQHLVRMGLGYLPLERPARTLSGGESQRIRLASLLGTSMFGQLYVLDEPSTGLHPKDTKDLIATLKALRDQGNTVAIVEHDHQMIQASDWVVELGPDAGQQGGEVVFCGSVEKMLAEQNSATARHMSPEGAIAVPQDRRKPHPERQITIVGARENNLTGIDVAFPLGIFTAVTGVSGAGKSTLVDDILFPALARSVDGTVSEVGAHDRIDGLDQVDRVIKVDQAPIGRSGRSTPATYTGVFDSIRKVFAATPGAKKRGYKPGRFSFNSAGGRCETCAGDGTIRVEVQLLPDVFLVCETCEGRRYDEETLEILYEGKNIAEVLEMSIEDAREFFAAEPSIAPALNTLDEVGLGYLRLGQAANTISGGEAQRVKLANELQRKAGAHTVFLLDEPTSGLHSSDIERLLGVLHSLVERGHTVVVVTHSLDVIKTADWVIDIGPDGGTGGGELVATGTPEAVARVRASHTGRFLKKVLAVTVAAGGTGHRPSVPPGSDPLI